MLKDYAKRLDQQTQPKQGRKIISRSLGVAIIVFVLISLTYYIKHPRTPSSVQKKTIGIPQVTVKEDEAPPIPQIQPEFDFYTLLPDRSPHLKNIKQPRLNP